jgi:hypothetical protein
MTSSHTLLIEPNRLFRQGLKHLLAGTRFEVGVTTCNHRRPGLISSLDFGPHSVRL